MDSVQRCLAISPNGDYEAHVRDEDLLRAARGGSHSAFAQLQKTHSHRVYKRILAITRNREDAEDALQDAFLSAYLALPSFEGKCQLSSWLMRIGINSALMMLRRRRRRPELPFEQFQDFEGDAVYMEVRDKALDPEQSYDQQQRCQAIRHELHRLDSKLQAAMCIRMSEGHSMKEIAERLGVSVASVKARLNRARKRLLRSPVVGAQRGTNSLRRRSGRDYPCCKEPGQSNADPAGTVGIDTRHHTSCAGN